MDLSHLEETIHTLLKPQFPPQISRTLANRLARSIKNNLRKASGNLTLLPDTFTLVMHPNQASQWQQNPQYLQAFKQALLELAQAMGVVFAASPNISLASNPSLAEGEIDVIASHRLAPSSSASALPAENTSRAAPPTETKSSIPEHAYLILDGGRVFKLRQAVVNIGRRLDNHVVLNDPRVSRNHAQLRAIKGRYVIFDLNSTGGTYVNGQRVSQSILYSGDTVSLAGATFVYRQDAAAAFDYEALGTQPLDPNNATDVPTAVFKTNPGQHKKR